MGNWWDNHGTKILGGITTLLSMTSAIAPLFGAQGIAIGTAAGAVLTGLGTVKRGFTNSENQAKP